MDDNADMNAIAELQNRIHELSAGLAQFVTAYEVDYNDDDAPEVKRRVVERRVGDLMLAHEKAVELLTR